MVEKKKRKNGILDLCRPGTAIIGDPYIPMLEMTLPPYF